MYHQLALSISSFFSIAAFLHLFHFYIFTFVSFLLCLSENSSYLMLFVDLNRHEIKKMYLVSCLSFPFRERTSVRKLFCAHNVMYRYSVTF